MFQSIRLLREEREQDEKLRNQYKQKWNRTPSDQLTKQLTEDQTKYSSLLQRSREADAKVKTQFEQTLDYMRILSLPKVKKNRLSYTSLAKNIERNGHLNLSHCVCHFSSSYKTSYKTSVLTKIAVG